MSQFSFISPSMRSHSTGLVLCCILLNACAVGPDFKRPEFATPDSFSQGKYEAFSDQSIELTWWQLFEDQTLVDLVQQTLSNNFDLKTVEANIREARALYLEAGTSLFPAITTHANYTEQKRSAPSLNSRSFVPRGLNLFSLGFDATWELDIFGRVRRNVEANRDEIAVQQANLHDISITLIAEVARNYFQLRGLQQQLSIAQHNVAIQEETLAITRARVAAGRGTDLDSSRALAQLQSTRAELPPLQSAIQLNVHRLSVLIGRLPGALNQSLSPAAPIPTLPDHINIGSPADLLRRRPDIRMAEHTLAASTARIGVAKADLFPRVTFNGSIGLEAATISGIGASGSDTYSFGPRISWQAFALNKVFARIKAANAHAEADLARYQQTVLNALEETENALISYNQEQTRQKLLAAAATASGKAHHIARLHYQAGISDFLTVLDAESRLLQDQNRLAQSNTSVATSLTALYKALGGGWEVTVSQSEEE